MQHAADAMMQFDDRTIDYLKGDSFNSGLRTRISKPESTIPGRVDFLTGLAAGKNVIHVGCVDHIPLIQDKIARGTWAHQRISESAGRCLGVDIDAEGLAYIRNLGYDNVLECNLITDPVPQEIAGQTWNWMILGEILEHTDDPTLFLQAIQSKYAGYVERVVITGPNALRIENFSMTRRHTEWINSDHRFWFSPYTLSKLVIRAGMKLEGFGFCQHSAVHPAFLHKQLLLRLYPGFRDTVVVTARLT
jgi:hypothetical protein